MKNKADRLKNIKKRKILKTALKHFSKYTFEEVSLRKISSEVGISVGNLYNYFESKDDLFRAALSPFLRKITFCKRFFSTHAAIKKKDLQEDFLEHLYISKKIAKFVHKNRQMISIILFHSKGSSLQNFPDQMIDFQTERFRSQINRKFGLSVFDFFFAHNLVSYFYNTIREGLMHDLDLVSFEKAIKEMIAFSYLGVMGLAQKKASAKTDSRQN